MTKINNTETRIKISKSKLFYDLQEKGWGYEETIAIINALNFSALVETIE